MSFSGKDAYDDVLLGAPKSKLGVGGGASRGVVAVEDYAEIFGAGAGAGGVGTVKRGSSIPVLDLSELDRSNGSYDSRGLNGKLDYSKIFGSFAADVDDDVGTGVPPYEDLFGGVKKAKRDKARKARNPAATKSPPKGSDCLNSSENSRGFSSEASDQFLDGEQQLNMSYHKTSQRARDGLNGTTHIAQLHAVPGFTYFIDEAARPQKTERDKPFSQVKTDAIHCRTSSGDLSEGKPSRRGRWQLPDRQASEGVVSGKDDSSWSEVDFKPYASDVPIPSSSSTNSNDDQGHPKRTKSSNFVPCAETLEKNSNGYSSPSDEELDVNSAAAASAAALKKAIQQAQESIRLAKELMERKKDPIQNSKLCVNGSFKVKDKREIKFDKDTSGCRKNNTVEACKTVSSDAQAFGGFDQKITRGSDEVASILWCREDLSIDRKVDTEKYNPIAEVIEEQGVGTWFSQLLNNGKSKMAALASQLVDNRNTIGQPTSKHMQGAEETIPAKSTLGRGTPDMGDINMKVDTLGKVPDFETNLNKSATDQFVQVGTRSKTLMSSQEDQTTEVEHGSHHQERCEKKEQDCEKSTCNIEPEILENGCPAIELKSIVEMNKEEESFELGIGIQLDNLFTWRENESSLDEKVNWRMPEDFCVQKGHDQKPEEVTTIGSSDKKQESSQHEHFSWNRLEGYHQEVIEVQRSICSPENIERKNTSKGENICVDIDRTPEMTYQHEGTDILDVSANDSADSDNIKVNLEDQESYDTGGEPDESEENLGPSLFPETANEENFSACKIDCGSITEGTSEASEVRKSSKQSRPLEDTVLEEDDDQIDAKELLESKEEKGHIEFREDEKEAEESVEDASVIKENKMFETSALDHNVPQEHVLESTIQDASKALDSDDNTKDFGLDTIIHEKRPSTDMNLLKTTVLNTGHGVEDESATEAPTVGGKPSDCEFADISRQKEAEGSDEECGVSIRPEDWEGLTRESAGDAKDMKEDNVACEIEFENHDFELDNKEIDWAEKKLEPDCSRLPNEAKDSEEDSKTNTDTRPDQTTENYEGNICKTSVKEAKENTERVQKEVKEKDFVKRIEIGQREREREKDRLAVERAIREARERAFAEARERAERAAVERAAERAAVERATAEVRQRAMAGAREKIEKLSAGPKASTDKATTGAKLRAERAAVERATAEARERALEKALSQKSTSETRSQVEKVVAGKSSASSRDAGLKHSFSSSDLEGTHNESAQRRKARLERHQRIMERAAKALAEKNMRDILAQREQAERNRLAETLDADIKRWASGKEGNLRALLSTLQYILGPDSGWQAMSLTEIITTNAVKKAYRKATLYVHPDKLQQRGASIQQKYICEKVFDLLKAAWNKFNSEER